ncbi:MAG: hypothetical protein CMM33_07205 [Rhodospirillaceae bacterium]|jgi:ectoine hydroxylase-related dioxygenase (phytanoyl-CoA dioxygenase family)|nr:hypothetical protein [Rhodospirillaceae bacterium]
MGDVVPGWSLGDPTPKPTREHGRAVSDLREFGYCIIEDALDDQTLEGVRNRLIEQAEAEIESGIAFEDQGPKQINRMGSPDRSMQYDQIPEDAFSVGKGGINQRVWMLVNKGEVFRNLVTHSFMTPLIEFLLGKDFLLSTLSANIAKPGGVEMGLHTDQWWMPRPSPRKEPHIAPGDVRRGEFYGASNGDPNQSVNPPCACNVMYCLNDFTELNGATRIVPKSHLTGLQPPPDIPHTVGSIPAEAKAGSAIVFEGRLWHGTGANQSNGNRLGLLATYCGPQFRTQENYTLGVDPAVVEKASPELLVRLGFKIWNAYGRTGDPTKGYVNKANQILGEMRPRNGQSETSAYQTASE